MKAFNYCNFFRGTICCAPGENHLPRNFVINRNELSDEEGTVYDNEQMLDLHLV